MSEKTIVFTPDGGSNSGVLGMLAPLLKNSGIDPNLLLAMNNGGGFGGNNGAWFLWIIVLFALFRNGVWGNGNDGNAFLSSQIANADGRELLMQGINGNRAALGELSSILNCSLGQIQTVLNGISNQVGLSTPQIVNAVQAGNCSLASQLASCCCDIKTAIAGVNVGLERGFSSIAYETQRQTCDITGAIKDSKAEILAGQRAAEMRELQRDIAERDRELAKKDVVINNAQQTNMFGQMISAATTPILNAVGALKSDVDGIKCKLPETATVPYSPVVGVPNCVAAQLGFYGGFPTYGNNFFGV